MKKEIEMKYPSSANLFQFCRRVLDHKFGGGVRVIDQDVGQILGFDPADCSHWKKGKKNVKSIHAMKSIAKHLGVDGRLIVDVANGDINDQEAYFEFYGYGAMQLDSKSIEAAKKEYFKKYANQWSKEKETEFKERFSINELLLDQIASEILSKINLQESPLYLPELVQVLPQLVHKPFDSEIKKYSENQDPIYVEKQEGIVTIFYPAGLEMKPHVRYSIAKKIAEELLIRHQFKFEDFGENGKVLLDVHANLLAAKILTPEKLVVREMQKVSVTKDIVGQLAELFWVSKSFMNRRLRDIISSL